MDRGGNRWRFNVRVNTMTEGKMCDRPTYLEKNGALYTKAYR